MTDLRIDKATRTAVHLQDTRDLLRRTMGEKYRPMVDKLEAAVRLVACAKGRDPFGFAIDEAKRATDGEGGMAGLQFLAVACEIAEVNKTRDSQRPSV